MASRFESIYTYHRPEVSIQKKTDNPIKRQGLSQQRHLFFETVIHLTAQRDELEKKWLKVKIFCSNEDIPRTLCRSLSVPIPTISAQKYGSGNSITT